jgi:hypothetical protein
MTRARRVSAAVRTLLLALAVIAAAPAAAAAQDAPPVPLRVFLDCYECDTEYLRQNVLFVDYMRDRTDADLHVLVTTQGTGGGGTAWTVRVLGLGRFAGQDRTVTFTTPQDATSDERRQEFARRFKLGLAGYAADTAVAPDLDVTFAPPDAAPEGVTPATDPWKLWVFRVNGNVQLNGEESRRSGSRRLTFSGNRVTPDWKTNFSVGVNDSETTFTLSDGRKVASRNDSWNANTLIVKSMGPRFSIGGRVSAGHSSFSNTDRSVSIYPGLEFNVFPYSEYERRSLTIWWEAGPNFYDYRETTIFDKDRETVIKQQMDVSLRLRQPWGSAGTFSSFGQDLRHPSRYNLRISGDADVRLFKGFSFNVFGSYARIKDQISLAKGGATEEEVLLRLRELSTDYSYFVSFGFSYSFGSIFNTVVNPRFGGSNIFFF